MKMLKVVSNPESSEQYWINRFITRALSAKDNYPVYIRIFVVFCNSVSD